MKKDGFITLNGEEFPVDRIRYNPYFPVSIVSGEVYMHPYPFPKPFPLTIGSKKYTKQLMFQRIPNESVNTAAFESQAEQALTVHYFVDELKQTISFNISFNLSYAKTIRDIVEPTSIYNAFVDGEGLFCGTQLITDIDTSKVKKYDLESLAFWEKVLLIEDALGVAFEPPQEDVDLTTISTIETLYQNLINNNPIRENKKIDSLGGEWDTVDNKHIQDSIGKAIYFEFQATSHLSLFGVDIALPCVVGIFDSILSNYTCKGKKYKLILEHLNEDKHMYTSTLRFKTEQDLSDYMNGDRNQRISALQTAKTAQNYLRVQGPT
jgi:acyl carrier protein